MNKYAGKASVGAIAILGAAALAIVGLHRFSGRAYSADPTPALFVTDDQTEAVTAYAAASNGDVSPLAPAPTGLSSPRSVAFDKNGNIYVTNSGNATVTIYAKGSNGDAGPTAIIGGGNTGLSQPTGIAVDSTSGNIYVTGFTANNDYAPSVFVYSAGSNGNVAPIATISGPDTGMNSPIGVALDSSKNIYVADSNTGSVYVYPPLGSSTGLLNEAPTATIGSGPTTYLQEPFGVALDSSQNIYVADYGAASVYVYPALGSSTGFLNEDPIATIGGIYTGLVVPSGIALDPSGNIYVADVGATSVFVYPALGSSTGRLDESPTATISGSNTLLNYPLGVALDSSRNIYVADFGSNIVTVYPALGSSTGTLNESPTATISTTMTTGLGYPQGIALDSSGKIYVVDQYPLDGGLPSVFVYPAGSNGNAAPIATISGPDTGLSYPFGIALDSSGKIYVADCVDCDGDSTASVFVYPALGSRTGTLDEAPIATISGGKTGLEYPIGIALDSSRNIYVTNSPIFFGRAAIPSVFVYPAGSNGNQSPVATLNGSKTDLIEPFGIAVDSSGKIYVADCVDCNGDGTASVFVYPALGSSTGTLDEAPLATISGSNTGLDSPDGIALDSSDKIYVADPGDGCDGCDLFPPNVFVYPVLGSSTGLLNEVPAATISGPLTELISPVFVALQPSAAATPTPTATATGGTPTATATPTKTATPTASATATKGGGTPTATATTTKTATATATSSGSATPSATATATKTATATPTATGSGAPTATATASPTATATPTVTPTAVSSPTTLSASPTTIKFGSVDATATSKPKKVTLSNKGTAAAVIGTMTATPPFEIAGGANTCSGQTIAVKKKCSFDVEFAPTTVANVIGGSIDVAYNGTSPSVGLSGDGIAVTLKAPSKQTFSSVAAGGTGKPKNLKISNPATVSVKLATTIIGGSDPTAFTITANTCTGTLTGKGSCTITMEFTPKTGATGAQSATVGFSYTYGANDGSVSIPISGTVK